MVESLRKLTNEKIFSSLNCDRKLFRNFCLLLKFSEVEVLVALPVRLEVNTKGMGSAEATN